MPAAVAFFRNLNLGHPGSPDRLGLEAAFARAGADGIRSFQTNGTVAFEARAPKTVAARHDQRRSDPPDRDCTSGTARHVWRRMPCQI
ncbi:hypothetical protein G9U51_15355 [Calidifontibacter sp. DB0510]|uniref:DUF1697 domain-containing protein n=1 Tax=Metallococcus carri TaxID=1656884 RepID=A0A967B7S3_9MICO|nr:hypothetical protein [Metallococcus carri]NHN57147.1 hypothetical protein [Metallococcus carri]NOP38050.1 hypothetical protein [Calidifontibacter sp. DB2511S]